MEAVKGSRSRTEILVREFPAIGKYRVRVTRKADGPQNLDIREYVSAANFEGFTRRGVRFMNRAELEQLLGVVKEVLESIEA